MATPRKIYKESRVPMPTWPGMYKDADGNDRPERIIEATHRIQREGKQRWKAFQTRRVALKKRLMKAGEHYVKAANDESWAITATEFKPIPVDQWEDELESEAEPEPSEPVWTVPPLDVDEELSRLPTLQENQIAASFLWVADHRALSRKSPAGNLYVINSDIEGCPNRWAWNLLHMAIDDPVSFRKEMMQRIKPAKAGEAEDVGPTDSDADLDAILGRAMA